MPPASDVLNAPTITERVEKMSGEEFADYLTNQWDAVETRLMIPLREAVKEGEFSPIQGAKLASCITGEIFGYAEFHSSVLGSPVNELVNALSHRAKDYR